MLLRQLAIGRKPLLLTCRRRLHSLPSTVNHLLRLGNETKQDVEVNGWVQSIQKQKNCTLMTIGDGSSMETIQAIASEVPLG
jgi:hypothetical protein